MMDLLEFRQVQIGGFSLSFQVRNSEHVAVPDIDVDSAARVIDLALGIAPASYGNVVLFGEPLSNCSPAKMRRLRGRVGVVSESRGLISNLKVWENVNLPVEYHNVAEETPHQRVQAALEVAGYRRDPYALPSTLTRLERKQVLLARAFAAMPELLLFDLFLEGHSPLEKQRLRSSVQNYFQRQPQGAGIFLTSDKDELPDLVELHVASISREG